MESLLNFAWVMMAIACLCLWFRFGRRAVADRRVSFIALVMLLVILFPVISVSDDLWSVQNPAETDTCQRRDHPDSCSHTSLPAIAARPLPAFAELSFKIQRFSVSPHPFQPAPDNPALDPIQNRPPPTA
jgi:hypothetical protein